MAKTVIYTNKLPTQSDPTTWLQANKEYYKTLHGTDNIGWADICVNTSENKNLSSYCTINYMNVSFKLKVTNSSGNNTAVSYDATWYEYERINGTANSSSFSNQTRGSKSGYSDNPYTITLPNSGGKLPSDVLGVKFSGKNNNYLNFRLYVADIYFTYEREDGCYITFYNENGSVAKAAQGIDSGSYPTPPSLSKTGYTLYWKDSSGNKYLPANIPAAGNTDVNYTAYFEKNKSTLKVKPNGGTWNNYTTDQSYTKEYLNTMSIPLPTKKGYSFTSWSTSITNGTLSSKTAAATYTFGPYAGITDTITASYKINQYNLIINPNGGMWNNTASNTIIKQNYGTTYTITSIPMKRGYTFTGWTFSGTGSYNNNVFTYSNGTGTLTANWVRSKIENMLINNKDIIDIYINNSRVIKVYKDLDYVYGPC